MRVKNILLFKTRPYRKTLAFQSCQKVRQSVLGQTGELIRIPYQADNNNRGNSDGDCFQERRTAKKCAPTRKGNKAV